MNEETKNEEKVVREQLLRRYEWLTERDLELLAEKPAVVAFIEPDDTSLTDAIDRYFTATRAAREELQARGEKAHERMVTASGLQTTAVLGVPEKQPAKEQR